MSDTLTALVAKCAALDSLTARMGMVYQQELLVAVFEVLSAYRAATPNMGATGSTPGGDIAKPLGYMSDLAAAYARGLAAGEKAAALARTAPVVGAELEAANQNAEAAYGCLDMIREDLVAFGIDMSGTPPMMYNDAMRHALAAAEARGVERGVKAAQTRRSGGFAFLCSEDYKLGYRDALGELIEDITGGPMPKPTTNAPKEVWVVVGDRNFFSSEKTKANAQKFAKRLNKEWPKHGPHTVHRYVHESALIPVCAETMAALELAMTLSVEHDDCIAALRARCVVTEARDA